MSTVSSAPLPPVPPPSADPFRYGWRYVKRTLPDGKEDFEQVPLTLEDVLHPELGDVMPQTTPHGWDRIYLVEVLERALAADPHALVRVVCFDATGKEIGDYQQICEQLDAAEQRAEKAVEEKQAAEERAAVANSRIQELEAELRRLRGEA